MKLNYDALSGDQVKVAIDQLIKRGGLPKTVKHDLAQTFGEEAELAIGNLRRLGLAVSVTDNLAEGGARQMAPSKSTSGTGRRVGGRRVRGEHPRATTEAPARRKGGKRATRSNGNGGHGSDASHKLQGAYLARIRKVAKSKRGEFSKIVKEQGREAAIKALDQYLANR